MPPAAHRVIAGEAEGLLAVDRSEHLVAPVGEDVPGEGAYRRVVLDEQDALGAVDGRPAGGRPGHGDRRGDERQQDLERGAGATLARQGDRAAVLADAAEDGRDAEARALADVLGGVERLEGVRARFGIHAAAGVRDPQQDVVACGRLDFLPPTGSGRLGRIAVAGRFAGARVRRGLAACAAVP